MPSAALPTPKKLPPTIRLLLLIAGCVIGLAALPVACMVSSTVAREASSPVEEVPIGFAEASLVARVEWCGMQMLSDDRLGGLRVLRQTDALGAVPLVLPGHRWHNGLLAPLRT